MKNVLLTAATVVLSSFGMSVSAQNLFLVQEPASLAGSYSFTDSYTADGWGADLDATAITAPGAWALDGSAADSICCETVVNTGDVTGKIAFLYRGTCNFSIKAYHAQEAGAVGCVIVNNEPGNLINMLGGDSASAVHIPVIFISDADGAALRDSIISGTSEFFIGNPNGVFSNNVGAYNPHIGMASSQALPLQLADPAEFDVPIGSWIFNYGSEDAVNALVTAVIDRDGTEIYNETSIGETILPEDSLFVALPLFTQTTYEPGYYTITYTLVSDSTDELPVDNILTTSFWINTDGKYSKSRLHPIDGPQGISGLRPAESTEFEWCIAIQSSNIEPLWATGITFNTSTNDIDLTGEAVQLTIYEWNDPIADLTFTDLNEATDNEFYDYPSDLQSEFVTHTFSDAVELVNDQKYLACAKIFIDDMFLGTDGDIDYNATYDSYPDEVFYPLNDIDGNTWYAGGFGTDNTPAIVLNLAIGGGIGDDINALEISPYPNPTVDIINIPFGATLDGTVNLEVYDVAGRSVKSEDLCLNNAQALRLDVSDLSSGLHTFNLTFEDDSHASFRVVITK